MKLKETPGSRPRVVEAKADGWGGREVQPEQDTGEDRDLQGKQLLKLALRTPWLQTHGLGPTPSVTAHSLQTRGTPSAPGNATSEPLPLVTSAMDDHGHKHTINVPHLIMDRNGKRQTPIKQATQVTGVTTLPSTSGKADG